MRRVSCASSPQPQNVYNVSILEHDVKRTFDLVLIRGVLIHINPEALATVYELRSTGKVH